MQTLADVHASSASALFKQDEKMKWSANDQTPSALNLPIGTLQAFSTL
jgi:hypothetical protein